MAHGADGGLGRVALPSGSLPWGMVRLPGRRLGCNARTTEKTNDMSKEVVSERELIWHELGY